MEQLSFGFTQEEIAEDEVHQKPYCSWRVSVMQRISECDAFFGCKTRKTRQQYASLVQPADRSIHHKGIITRDSLDFVRVPSARAAARPVLPLQARRATGLESGRRAAGSVRVCKLLQ